MFISHWSKAASMLLIVGATVAGVSLVAQRGTSGAQARSDEKPKVDVGADVPTYQVKPGKLRVSVVERGNLESSSNHDVYCSVERQTTIIRIVPEGTRVKKGAVICELDSAAFRDSLFNQKIATEAAKASYQNAKLSGEVAERALTEYSDGIFKQELNDLKSEIASTQSAIRRAESRRGRANRARQWLKDAVAAKRGAKSADEIATELDLDDRIQAIEQALVREKMTLGLAETKLNLLAKYARDKAGNALKIDVLEAIEQTLVREKMTLGLTETKLSLLAKHTRDKALTALKGDVERKRSDELGKQMTWDVAEAKAAKLEQQIAACTLRAPVDGVVIYANDPIRPDGQPQIEEGATVRERQKIISISDLSRMQVNVQGARVAGR